MNGGRHSGLKLALAHRGDAGEQCVDENRTPVGRDGHIVRVDVAGDPGYVRREHRVLLAMGGPFGNDVVETQELVLGRQHERAGISAHAQAHAAREGALEDRQPSAGVESDQEQLAGLLGGESEARARARQPFRKMPRRGERELLFRRAGSHSCGRARGHRAILRSFRSALRDLMV